MPLTLVCLHGWGGTKESFTELRAALLALSGAEGSGGGVTVLTPDLPGFGSEPEPDRPWTVADYAQWVKRYIEQNVQGPYHLLGHSHGGRIAINLIAEKMLTTPPEHLYLCAAAGIRRLRHFKRIIGLILAKAGKTLLQVPGFKKLQPLARNFLYKLVRVHDYEKASPLMQRTLINITSEDLRPLLSQISLPTDLFWGEDDKMTPVADANIMKKAIPQSTLHLYPGIRHRVHRERAPEIAAVILERMQK